MRRPNRFTPALLLTFGLATAPAAGADTAPPRTWQDPLSGMEFVRVEKSCFRMGNDTPVPPERDGGWDRLEYGESLSSDEGPVHEACLDGYWLGRYEVTRGQWRKVMGALPVGLPEGGDTLPVTRITWHQARDFAERLSAQTGGKYRFRLPSEAEWEFACRGGRADALDLDVPTNTDELARMAVADVQAPNPPEPVGTLAPNRGGFHDLLGNVWEWVADDYAADAYNRHRLYNPRNATGADQAVIRGGSLRTEFVQARCTMRGRYAKRAHLDLIGLRIVRED